MSPKTCLERHEGVNDGLISISEWSIPTIVFPQTCFFPLCDCFKLQKSHLDSVKVDQVLWWLPPFLWRITLEVLGFWCQKKYTLLSEITQSRDSAENLPNLCLHPLIYSFPPKACSIHFLYHYCLTLLDVPLVCFREANRRPPYMLKKRHHHICLSHVSTGCAVSAQNVCLHILFSCWPLHKQIHVYNSRIIDA